MIKEVMYKNITIQISHTFGFMYHFQYKDFDFSEFFNSVEAAIAGAKAAIDILKEKEEHE